ncbi:hypothetical protein KEM56_004806 [Ascosphaera pollenicola]|nr:hypothetical protein KEM56_004806 [Ascosphaera pollenicola]
MGLFHRRERSSSSAAAQAPPPIQTGRYRSGSNLGPRPQYQEYAPPPGPPPSHSHSHNHSLSAGYLPHNSQGYGRSTEPELHEQLHHMSLGPDPAHSVPSSPRAVRRNASPSTRSPPMGRNRAYSRPDEASDQLIMSKYGLLFDNLGRPTRRFGELMLGIANFIVQFYMVPTEPQSREIVPAMTHEGFKRWMTLMVEAFPDQEHERLNKVMTMEIRNPEDKSERFPSRLPRGLLPARSNPEAHARIRAAFFEHFGLSVPGVPVVQVHSSSGGALNPAVDEEPIRAVARRGHSHSRSVSRGRVPPRINIPNDDDGEVFTEGGPGVGNLSATYTGAMGSLSSPNRSRAASMTPSGHKRIQSGLSPEADRKGRSRGATIGARYDSPLRSPNTPASVPDDSWHQSPPPAFNLSQKAERSPARGHHALGYRDSGESLFGRRY